MTDTEILRPSGTESRSGVHWSLSQRGLLKLLGSLGLVSSARPTSAQQAATNETWPQFSYDAGLTGHAPENTGPVDAIENDWRTSIEDISMEQPEVETPIVTAESVFIGTEDGTLVTLNRADGTERWRVQLDDQIWGPPAVSGEMVLCGTIRGSVGSDGATTIEGGAVYAFEMQSGNEQWSLELPSSVNGGLTVSEDTVYCCCLGAGLYAIDIATGSEQWVYETEALVEEAPAVVDGTVYIGDNDGNVHAVEATDGSRQWRFQADDAIRSSPVVTGGNVIAGSDDNRVYALDVGDGSEQWSFTAGDQIRVSPAITEEAAYVGSMDGSLHRLNVKDGTEQWAVELPEASDPYPLEPALVNEVLYVGYCQDDVYAVDPADGSELWTGEIEGGITSSVAVADATVYIGTQTPAVVAVTGATEPIEAEQTAASEQTGDSSTATNTQSAPETTESTEPPVQTTGAVAQQQGTVTGSQSANDTGESGSLWRQFDSSGSVMGLGGLVLGLGVAGIYGLYRRLSTEEEK